MKKLILSVFFVCSFIFSTGKAGALLI